MPLRFYLAGLAVLFVLGAGGALVYGRVQAENDARAAAQADARFAARLAAGELGDGVKSLRQTVAAAAANPGVAKAFARPEDCGLSFAGTDAYSTGHLDLVRTNGTVACSSLKSTRGSYAGAPWLARALRGPILLAPVTDPRSGKAAVLSAAPAPGLGVVLALFYLDAVGPSLGHSYGGPRGLELLVTDASGRKVLARSRDSARWVGAPLAGTVFSAARDVDGRERLYGRAVVPGTGWRVYAGADRAQALAATHRLDHRELWIILAGLLAFLAASLVVHHRIARPLERLNAAIRGAAREGTPRRLPVAGPAEVAGLARRLNELGEDILASERAYRVLFEGSPLPMWVYDTRTRRILEVNPAAVALDGRTEAEVLAGTADDLAGQRGDLELSVTSHSLNFRGHEACFVIAEDVTEKERLRHGLQQSQRLESLGQLAGGVAHDFNNLLAVILGYGSFIERRAAPGSPDERDAVQIRQAGERATRLTQQLLSFARREVSRPQVLDVTGVVIEMEQLLRRTLGDHVRLATSLAPDLWPVLADHGQLEQVLVNLAVNARDAMPDGGTLTLDTENIEVDAAYAGTRPGLAPGPYVRLRVSDDGIGMEREVIARAFEPFFTTKPKGQGTGLGLATIYGIVTQAGGDVHIYSEPGVGTTFTILLPSTDAPVPAAAGALPEPRAGGGETILVVDDEPAVLEVTRRILAGHDYDVLPANGGAAALSLVAEHDGAIDLVLTDVVMPDMLGKEVAERVAALRPGIRVLFMSGYAQAVVEPVGDLTGGAEIIDKPFSAAGLLTRVRETLDERSESMSRAPRADRPPAT